MPDIIACPSCGGKLRIREELHGQTVRCPACRHTFDSPAEPESPADSFRAPQDLPLELTLDEASSPQAAPSSSAAGLFGAVELSPASEPPSPSAEAPPSKPPRRRESKRVELDLPNVRRLGIRRDAKPDRGAAVLALGIISLALILVWCATLVGAILGLAAWIMGQIDLRKMKRGQMDDQNRGMTQAGWICGILGTLLNGLVVLSCGAFLGTIWYDAVNRSSNTQPIPAARPVRPALRKGVIPPPPPVAPPKNLPQNEF